MGKFQFTVLGYGEYSDHRILSIVKHPISLNLADVIRVFEVMISNIRKESNSSNDRYGLNFCKKLYEIALSYDIKCGIEELEVAGAKPWKYILFSLKGIMVDEHEIKTEIVKKILINAGCEFISYSELDLDI